MTAFEIPFIMPIFGKTGSGKTTTIANILSNSDNFSKKRYSELKEFDGFEKMIVVGEYVENTPNFESWCDLAKKLNISPYNFWIITAQSLSKALLFHIYKIIDGSITQNGNLDVGFEATTSDDDDDDSKYEEFRNVNMEQQMNYLGLKFEDIEGASISKHKQHVNVKCYSLIIFDDLSLEKRGQNNKTSVALDLALKRFLTRGHHHENMTIIYANQVFEGPFMSTIMFNAHYFIIMLRQSSSLYVSRFIGFMACDKELSNRAKKRLQQIFPKLKSITPYLFFNVDDLIKEKEIINKKGNIQIESGFKGYLSYKGKPNKWQYVIFR